MNKELETLLPVFFNHLNILNIQYKEKKREYFNPAFIQFIGVQTTPQGEKVLRFVSSQNSQLKFDITIQKELAEYCQLYTGIIYDFFRNNKYNHLKTI
jgi:hypothetical protein